MLRHLPRVLPGTTVALLLVLGSGASLALTCPSLPKDQEDALLKCEDIPGCKAQMALAKGCASVADVLKRWTPGFLRQDNDDPSRGLVDSDAAEARRQADVDAQDRATRERQLAACKQNRAEEECWRLYGRTDMLEDRARQQRAAADEAVARARQAREDEIRSTRVRITVLDESAVTGIGRNCTVGRPADWLCTDFLNRARTVDEMAKALNATEAMRRTNQVVTVQSPALAARHLAAEKPAPADAPGAPAAPQSPRDTPSAATARTAPPAATAPPDAPAASAYTDVEREEALDVRRDPSGFQSAPIRTGGTPARQLTPAERLRADALLAEEDRRIERERAEARAEGRTPPLSRAEMRGIPIESSGAAPMRRGGNTAELFQQAEARTAQDDRRIEAERASARAEVLAAASRPAPAPPPAAAPAPPPGPSTTSLVLSAVAQTLAAVADQKQQRALDQQAQARDERARQDALARQQQQQQLQQALANANAQRQAEQQANAYAAEQNRRRDAEQQAIEQRARLQREAVEQQRERMIQANREAEARQREAMRYYPPLSCASPSRQVRSDGSTILCMQNNCGRTISVISHSPGMGWGMWNAGAGRCHSWMADVDRQIACEQDNGFDHQRGMCRR